MLSTEAFLDLILPAQGRRCVVTIPEQGPRLQRFYDTNAEAASAIARIDAKLVETKGAVYHGCATYGETNSRKAEDVKAIQSFWLDIDAGDGQAYPSARAAAESCVAFCGAASLVLPLFVRSGRGLHCYWPLAHALTRLEWLPYAQGLKQACQRHGLHAGPERTADAASILRPPGTWHRKGQPLPVISGPAVARQPIEAFAHLRLAAPALHFRQTQISTKPGLAARLSQNRAPETIDFDLLSSRCPQLGVMRATGGQVPEPVWYACLGVLARCAKGETIAHAWSSGHPTYSAIDTQSRLDRVSALSGPPTCAHFQSLNDTCGTCAFKGRAVTPLDVCALAPAASGPVFDVRKAEGLPELPGPIGDYFHAEDGGLYVRHETRAGLSASKKISSFPIRLVAVNTGELKNTMHFYHLQIWKPFENWIDVDITAAIMFSSTAASKLADLGIIIHDTEHFKNYMRLQIDALATQEKRTMKYEQFGWKEDEDGTSLGFLYGNRFYAKGVATRVSVSDDMHVRSQWLQPTRKGSVEGWREAADSLLFGQGTEAVAFGTLASLAATLMRFQERREGGAMVALVTRDSASGKTTTLSGAYTIWCSDPRGMKIKKKDTSVSTGIVMGMLGNLPIIYDEFWNRDAEIMYEEVMMFTGGEDKNRGAKEGGLKHNAAMWQTIFLSASNMSLVGALQSLNRPEAAAFRVLEMPVTAVQGLNPVEAGQLLDQLHFNGGHLGDAFLKALTRPEVLNWVKQQLPIVTTELYKRGGFGREHRYWVRTLGAVAVAAQLVTHLKLVSFNPDRIVRWAYDYVMAMKREGFVKNDGSEFMIGCVSSFLNEHLAETLEAPTAFGPGKARNFIVQQQMRKLTARRDADTGLYTIDKQAMKQWLQKRQIGMREFLTDLYGKGILLSDGKLCTLGAGTNLPGGQVMCILIDGEHPSMTGRVRLIRDIDPIVKRSTTP